MNLFFAFLFMIIFLSDVVGGHQNDTQPEWVSFGEDNLYALLEEQHFHVEAENRCVELGGHLVSIHSKEENDFIHQLRKNNSVWIGKNKLNDPNINGTYTWTDGSPHDDYPFPWDLRQPNEPWTNCIFMAFREDNNGEWSDYFCDQKLPPHYTPNPPFAVCKKTKKFEGKKRELK